MEGYRSGHNEAVLKTVWVHAHVGSNPTPSVKTKRAIGLSFVFIKSAHDEEPRSFLHVPRLISTIIIYGKRVKNSKIPGQLRNFLFTIASNLLDYRLQHGYM